MPLPTTPTCPLSHEFEVAKPLNRHSHRILDGSVLEVVCGTSLQNDKATSLSIKQLPWVCFDTSK